MRTIEDAFEYERAVVFGIGGSGDVVGSIPTARLLERHGVEVLLGGITWEPVPYDCNAGPRELDEIINITPINETVGLATGDTQTRDGLEFKETVVARHYSDEVALIDISNGVNDMVAGIDDACDELDIDLVIGVDAGGDVLASGTEEGLRSPVTDSFGLVALEEVQADSCLGMFGYGSDGELTCEELEAGIARAASRNGLLGAWGLTPQIRDELEELLRLVETEASRLPVEAARGEYGPRTIRNEAVTLQLTPPSTVTFYFDPATVASTSRIVSLVRDTQSLSEATTALKDAGYTTEFEIGQQRLESTS